MGDIKIKIQQVGEVVLQDVRYVSSAPRNLISLGELHGNAYVHRVDMNKLTMRVKENQKLVMKGGRTKNNMYKVHVCIVPGGTEEKDKAVIGVVKATKSDGYSDAGSCE